MTLDNLIRISTIKNPFNTLQEYFDFAILYLQFIDNRDNYEGKIRSQNDRRYCFYQYSEDGNYNITRPINEDLWLNLESYISNLSKFTDIIDSLRNGIRPDQENRHLVAKYIYTTQQTVGAVLDSLPAGQSNKARKINGNIFEQFIRELINSTGFKCKSGTVFVPVKDENNETAATVQYQHDILIENDDEVKVIGSVKTTSKDRLDKIFVDKFLYSRLTGTNTPHIAICLNDVQRKDGRSRRGDQPIDSPTYQVASTFLPGRFKAYTIRLNPLDGVYYCDLRPNMISDPLLSAHIKGIDDFFYDDLYRLVLSSPSADITVKSDDSENND